MKNLFLARNGILALFLLPPALVMAMFILGLAAGPGVELSGLPAIFLSALGVLGTLLILLRIGNQLNEQEAFFTEQIRNQHQALIELDSELTRLKTVIQDLERPQKLIDVQDSDTSEKISLECESPTMKQQCLEVELNLHKEVLAILGSKKSSRAVLEVVCRELSLAFGVGQCAAALMNDEQNSLTVVAEYCGDGFTSALNIVIPIEGNPATLYVLKNKVPLAIYDAQHDILLAPIQDIMKERGVASLLLLPILVNNMAVGTIGLDSSVLREFSDCEIAMVSRIVDAVASAVACFGVTHEELQNPR